MVDLSIRPEQAPKPYMTVIPNRHPRQKLHSTIGQAKNAALTGQRFTSYQPKYVVSGRDCAIYEWNSKTEQWDLLYEIRAGDKFPWRDK